ncbi:MAG: hypothetical protein P8188_01130, partial [Gemmatimonadota bacterium]
MTSPSMRPRRRAAPPTASLRRAPAWSILALAVLALPTGGQELDPARLDAMEARSIGPAGMSGRITAIDALDDDPR